MCERGLERGLLPHTNLGALGRDDLARLREVTASQGLMLESLRPDLVAHQGSPTKAPELRLATIAAAEELRIPFTSGILVGIGETEEDRMAALEALAGFGAPAGGHPAELRPAPPLLRRGAGRDRHRGGRGATGVPACTTGPDVPAPAWSTPVTVEDMERLVAEARRLMPEIGIQIPPNLADWWPQLVRAGATDLGGLSANGDHISPEHPFPSPHQVRKRLAGEGIALTERLCVYPRFIDPEWMAQGVLDVVKAPLLELHPTPWRARHGSQGGRRAPRHAGARPCGRAAGRRGADRASSPRRAPRRAATSANQRPRFNSSGCDPPCVSSVVSRVGRSVPVASSDRRTAPAFTNAWRVTLCSRWRSRYDRVSS